MVAKVLGNPADSDLSWLPKVRFLCELYCWKVATCDLQSLENLTHGRILMHTASCERYPACGFFRIFFGASNVLPVDDE